MTLVELNESILDFEDVNPSLSKYDDYSEMIKQAIVEFDGIYDKSHLKKTQSRVEFYSGNPMLDACIDDYCRRFSLNKSTFKKEFFYSLISGVYVPHIPSELTAMAVFSKNKYFTPNRTIDKMDRSVLSKYICDKGVVKTLLDVLFGYKVNLITSVRPMVSNNGIVEIYIANIDGVLLCNEGIREILSDISDIKSLAYSKEKGVVVGKNEVPLRTLIHSFGITEDDMDLRSVLFADG